MALSIQVVTTYYLGVLICFVKLFSSLFPNLGLYELVPRKEPLPDFEIQICQRLRHARELRLVPRTKLAQALGITMSRLNNYERAVAAVPAEIAFGACKFLNINQFWLAAEKGEMEPFIDFIQTASDFQPDENFGDYYKRSFLMSSGARSTEFGRSIYFTAFKLAIENVTSASQEILSELENNGNDSNSKIPEEAWAALKESIANAEDIYMLFTYVKASKDMEIMRAGLEKMKERMKKKRDTSR